jgi:hypothetical protein
MKKFLAVAVLFAAFTFGISLISGCSKNSDDGSGGSTLSIPNMTAAVSGNTTASISNPIRTFASIPLNQQNSGMLFTGTGPSASVPKSVFDMVKSFVSNAKTSDSFACMVEVLANNSLLKTDGTETVFSDDQESSFKAKFVVNATGSNLNNFKMYICNSSSAIANEIYAEGTRTGNDMSFTLKFDSSGSIQGAMTMTGVVDGSNWVSKSLTMETYFSSIVSKFQISQNASNMIVKGTINTGSAASTYQMYSKFGLLGNSPSTYAMSEGTVKYANNGSNLSQSWDISGATQSTSAYAADVTSGTYFDTNIFFTGAMTSGQTWDCAVGSSTEVKVSTMSPAVLTAVQSCMENQ